MIKGVDATWLLKQALQSGNEDYIRAVQNLKSLQDTPMDDFDIQQHVWDLEEHFEDD
jgi:hypothetical protein